MLVNESKNLTITKKVSGVENKITTNHDHDKYITIQEFNKLINLINFTVHISINKFGKQKWYF